MYWDTPDRDIDPPEDPKMQKAFERYLDSKEYRLDLAEAIEDLVQKTPHVFAEFVIDAQADMNLAILMSDPCEFGCQVREEVERQLVQFVEEDVQQAWVDNYESQRRSFH